MSGVLDPGITIDERDRRTTRRGVDETHIQGDVAAVLHQPGHVIGVVTLGRLDQRERDLLVSGSKNRTRCVVRWIVAHEVVTSCRPGLVAGQTPQNHGILLGGAGPRLMRGPCLASKIPLGVCLLYTSDA